MNQTMELDAREIKPPEKHQTIFNKYDDLQAGEQFVLVNDHDPKPLFNQFHKQRTGRFTWEYLEQGPEVWRVAIGKPGNLSEPTVAEIVAHDFRTASIFKRHGIDFCCGGNQTLSQASESAGIETRELLAELNTTQPQAGTVSLDRFGDWSIELLISYILENHHNWLKARIPEMQPVMKKVAKVHGEHHPELIQIADIFQSVVDDLIPHLQKEEIILFPYVQKLVVAKTSGEAAPRPFFGSVANPISGMEADHETVGELMASLRKLSADYRIPEDACGSYRMVYQFLEELEADLHQHIHLENNILFPRVRDLASELNVL